MIFSGFLLATVYVKTCIGVYAVSFKIQSTDVRKVGMHMNNAVDIGLKFEENVLKELQAYGLNACRTNKANIHDPEGFKQGFDGGVDIIATYQTSIKKDRDFVFFIQCKCQKHPLEKSAISEVYAGMHVRKGFGDACIPVVIATCEASQETIQYAKELGVELFLNAEANLVRNANQTFKVPYGNYGILTKVLLYQRTKDMIWLDTLPSNGNLLSSVSMTEQLLADTKAAYDKAQSYIDSADNFEQKAREQRQKALDIQRNAAYRAIQINSLANNNKESHTKNEKPTVIDDSG